MNMFDQTEMLMFLCYNHSFAALHPVGQQPPLYISQLADMCPLFESEAEGKAGKTKKK